MQNANYYTQYDAVSGAILSTGSTSGRIPSFSGGTASIEGSFTPRLFYVDIATQKATERIVFVCDVTRQDNSITIAPLPFGTKVSTLGEIFDVDDGVFELELDQPAQVTISIAHSHYFPHEFLI